MARQLTFFAILAFLSMSNADVARSASDPTQTNLGNVISYSTGDPRACRKENKRLVQFEVLPGLGWDNLRNENGGNVIVYNYSSCKTTLDGRFLIPDDVETIPRKSSKVNTFAELISHYTEYTSVTAHSVNVHADFGYGGVSIGGSFSDNYQHVKSKQIGDKSVTTRVQLRYVRYTARLKSKPQLHPDFKARLVDIGDSLGFNRSDEARFKSQLLVRDFGTHYLQSVDAGAVLVQEDQISSKYVNSKDSTKTEITVGASASFFNIFKFSASYKSSSSESEIKKYMMQRSSSEISTYGGPKFEANNFTANDWTKGVDENMVAVDRQGDLLHYLITPANLPELHVIQVQRLSNAVKEAIGLYYKYNAYRGCTKIDSPNFSPAANIDDGTCEASVSSTTFGGLYQTCHLDPRSNNGDICSAYNMNQKNPLSGKYSCPTGYQSIEIHSATLSTPKINPSCYLCYGFYLCCHDTQYFRYRYSAAFYSLYWCAAIGKAPANSGYLFGGVFTSHVNNPLTKDKSCPLNFYPRQLGTDLKVCISDDYELGSKYAIPFGGFISCESGNPLAVNNTNTKNGGNVKSTYSLQSFLQSTGSWPKRCPSGFSQHLAYVDQGCEISYCLKSGSLSSKGLPVIRRPPFMNPPDYNSVVKYMALDPSTQKWIKIEDMKDSKNRSVQRNTSTQSLSTEGIVGVAIGAMLFGCVLTVAIIVMINIKRRSSRERNEGLLERQSDYGTAGP